MTDDQCLSLYEVADLLGYTAETLIILIDYGVGPDATQTGAKPFLKGEVENYRRGSPKSPNELLRRSSDYGSLFAQHDDGRWWPRFSREDAVQAGEPRYFDGGTCALGHCAERHTKTQDCVICYKTPFMMFRRHVLREADKVGCNLP